MEEELCFSCCCMAWLVMLLVAYGFISTRLPEHSTVILLRAIFGAAMHIIHA